MVIGTGEWVLPVSSKKVYFQFFFLFCKCIFDLYEHRKFEYVSQPLWDKQAGPILAVYCTPLSHAVTCPFSKKFQILYIFAKSFKYFALSRTFLRGHWFWNGGLRHLLNASTWHLGKFQAVFVFFIFFFSLLYFLLTCTFKPWLLDSLDQPRYGSESHTQSNTQTRIWNWLWFRPMLSWKFCHQETFCVFIYGEKVFILSYTEVLHGNIFKTQFQGKQYKSDYEQQSFVL